MAELFRDLTPAKGKVALLYEAVLELLFEGHDISTMKVADITGKAGIGKGTAYEYFSSREEIIVQALLWDLSRMLMEASVELDRVDGFEKKYLTVLDWIEKRLRKWCVFGIFLKLQQEEPEFSAAFHRELKKHMPVEDVFMERVNMLVMAGREEKVIREDISDSLAKYLILSQLLSFILFLHYEQKEKSMTEEEMKKFSLETLLKVLG